MAVETLFGGPQSFELQYAADVRIYVSGEHGYRNTSFPKDWRFWVEVDGAEYPPGVGQGGGFGTEQPRCFAALIRVPAGQHSFAVKWYGAGGMVMQSALADLDIRYAYGGSPT